MSDPVKPLTSVVTTLLLFLRGVHGYCAKRFLVADLVLRRWRQEPFSARFEDEGMEAYGGEQLAQVVAERVGLVLLLPFMYSSWLSFILKIGFYEFVQASWVYCTRPVAT